MAKKKAKRSRCKHCGLKRVCNALHGLNLCSPCNAVESMRVNSSLMFMRGLNRNR